MYSNWKYQILPEKFSGLKKIHSWYHIFYIWSQQITTWWNFLNSYYQPYFQYHMPFYCKNTFNNIFPIIIKSSTKIKWMSCNTLCPCIFSVWEQYFKILHNMHFDHAIWHHDAFCNIFVWKMSLCVCCDMVRLIWTW